MGCFEGSRKVFNFFFFSFGEFWFCSFDLSYFFIFALYFQVRFFYLLFFFSFFYRGEFFPWRTTISLTLIHFFLFYRLLNLNVRIFRMMKFSMDFFRLHLFLLFCCLYIFPREKVSKGVNNRKSKRFVVFLAHLICLLLITVKP